MNKILIILIYIIFINGCSLNKNSKFWSQSQKISEDQSSNYKEIFLEDETLEKEFNTNILINLGNVKNNNLKFRDNFNNDGRLNYDGEVKKSSRYKFSKIKKFYQFEPVISFDKKNIIFLSSNKISGSN